MGWVLVLWRSNAVGHRLGVIQEPGIFFGGADELWRYQKSPSTECGGVGGAHL